LVYKLGGTATLPALLSYTPPALNPPANFGDAALLAQGEAKYTAHCASCHGTSVGRVSSVFPDLRYAAALNAEALFKAIVIDGALQNNGMVSFAAQLSPQDAEAIRAYVVSLANVAKDAQVPAPLAPAPTTQVH
jgi:mono/diheme cytochrome c family protein